MNSLQNHSDVFLGQPENAPKMGDFFIAIVVVRKIQGKMVTAHTLKIMKSNMKPEQFDNYCGRAQRSLKVHGGDYKDVKKMG